MRPIEETSTITATGQTTVPKAVRQALGVAYGGKIAFRIERGRVTVHNPEAEHRDPALEAFLGLLDKDIDAGRNVRDLPPSLVATMRHAMAHVPIDLNEPLEVQPRAAGADSPVTDAIWEYMMAHPRANYSEVSAALDLDSEGVRYPVKYWKQITGFLSATGKLRVASDYPSFSTRSKERSKVWEYMLAHPDARAVDVAAAVKVRRGVVSFPVRYWKEITKFLRRRGMLRTR